MSPIDVDGLLRQARWVEGFARALVREDAEDVAQDAWLAAIQHPPAPAASPRPWFATVMRNLKRMRFRSDSRRLSREQARAPDDHVPTPRELAHRMELQRRLASAVLALDEPQRTTVVLAFYEGLSPAEIARRDGVPATTVRSRLRAALVTLRERLDAEEGGDRARWQLAFAPLAATKLAAPTAPLWPLAAAALALVATAVVAVAVPRDADPRANTSSLDTRAWSTSPEQRSPGHPAVPVLATTTEVSPGASTASALATAERTLMKHVDECYDISQRTGSAVRGIVQLTIALEPTDGGVDATVEIDPARTTIVDPELLECIRENARAIEDPLERLRDLEEPIQLRVTREMPPTPGGAELVQMAPPTPELAPSCPEGAALAGARGSHQWCVLPDGTKHGPDWLWDAQGRVTSRTTYDHGATSMEMLGPDGD